MSDLQKRVLVVVETGEGFLRIVDSHDDAREARQSLRQADPGTYHILTMLEADIPVSPPPEVTENKVGEGHKFRTVTRKPKAPASVTADADDES